MTQSEALKLKVGQVQIGDKVARVYFDTITGTYSYSKLSIEKMLELPENSIRHFLASKTGKVLLHKVETTGAKLELTYMATNKGSRIHAVSCELATRIIIHYATRGVDLACELLVALTKESLQLRAMRAFGTDTQDAVHSVQDTNNEQLATKHRKEARSRHMSWQNACKHLGLNPRVAHEKITLAVWGMTASEARKLPLTGHADEVWANKSVGINHHPDAEKMRVYYLIKDRIVSYRAGDLTERLNRAIKELEISPVK